VFVARSHLRRSADLPEQLAPFPPKGFAVAFRSSGFASHRSALLP
jgi:hypothetical protein